MPDILIVEDDIPINELIKRNLTLVGHACVQAFNGLEAEEKIEQQPFDLIILDVMLPKKTGFELMENIHDTPVIFLTAKNALSDKVQGLNIGADDYIIKPFEMLELLARINALLRRTQKLHDIFEFGDTKVDLKSHCVYVHDKEIELAPREYALLETLIMNRNIALSREKLIEIAWGWEFFGDTRTVDVHIQKLRKKMGWENIIKTVYKLGYRLEVIK